MFAGSLYVYFHECQTNLDLVGNKAISKRVFQENKTRQIFRKTNMPYSLIHKRTSVHFKLPSYHEHLPETLFTTGTCYHFNNLNGEMQCS